MHLLSKNADSSHRIVEGRSVCMLDGTHKIPSCRGATRREIRAGMREVHRGVPTAAAHARGGRGGGCPSEPTYGPKQRSNLNNCGCRGRSPCRQSPCPRRRGGGGAKRPLRLITATAAQYGHGGTSRPRWRSTAMSVAAQHGYGGATRL